MKLHINGDERQFDSQLGPFTLASLVEMLAMKADRVAVELNRNIVPRDRWSETSLNDGDSLEIVHFVGGGSGPLPTGTSLVTLSATIFLAPGPLQTRMFQTFCRKIV
ncbi:MAG: sulfur carrier protein ThiS [Candidatus Sulfotelmatobacter sp.]